MEQQLKTAAKSSSKTPASQAPASLGLLQRKCACGEPARISGECDECRKKRLQPEIRNSKPAIRNDSWIPPIVHEVLRSVGEPLDPDTRAFMESRFGHDFSHVRVHTDAKAAESARGVNALAYTLGDNVVFGEKKYSPTTHGGRELLAHELAHAIQQRGASSREEPVLPSSALEVKAEHAGRDVANGRTLVGSLGSSKVAVARQPVPTDKEEEEEEEETPVPMTLPIGKAGRIAPSSRRRAPKLASGRPTTLSLIQPDPRQITDEELDLLPQAGSIERARTMLGTRKAEERAQEQTEGTKRENRRNRTIRYFRKIPDQKLEDAYRSRLRLYLVDRSKGQEYWDLETMEDILQQRAPNAPWREEARQEFLAQLAREKRLPQLPEKVRSQFQKLDDKTQGWTREERDLAQELLWSWVESYDQGLGSTSAIDRVRKQLVGHYETWLRGADRAIQEDCKSRPRPASLSEKIRRNLEKAHGDPCEPWFEESHQHGYLEVRDLERFVRVTTDRERPEFKMYLNIHGWVEEFRARTNPEAILARMRGQALVGIVGGGFGGLGARLSIKLPKYEPFPAWPKPSAGATVTPRPTSPVPSPKRPIGFKLPHQAPPAPPVPEPQVLQTVTPSRRVPGFARRLEPKPEPVPLTPDQTVSTQMPPARVVQGDQPTYGNVKPAVEMPGQGPATTPSRRVVGFQRSPRDVAEKGLVEVDIGPREYVMKEYFGDVGAAGEQQSRYHVNIQLDEQGMMEADVVLRGGGRRSGSLFGKQEFLEAKRHFEQVNGPGSVKGVHGRWGGGDNLETFNSRFKLWKGRGLSDEAAMIEAAGKTKTGEWVAAAGFKTAKIIKTEGPPGAFTNVEVEFTKSGAGGGPSSPSPVPTNVPPPLSPSVGGFGRKSEPPPPATYPQGPLVSTWMPPARVMPSSPSGVIGERGGKPTRAMAGKPPGGGGDEPKLEPPTTGKVEPAKTKMGSDPKTSEPVRAGASGVPEEIPAEQSSEITQRRANAQPAGGEMVGEFRVSGDKRLNGSTFERDVFGLENVVRGPTTNTGPIRQLFRDFIQEARAAGATRLRITGNVIRNPNVLRMRRIVEEFGGTVRTTGSMSNEIIIPL